MLHLKKARKGIGGIIFICFIGYCFDFLFLFNNFWKLKYFYHRCPTSSNRKISTYDKIFKFS